MWFHNKVVVPVISLRQCILLFQRDKLATLVKVQLTLMSVWFVVVVEIRERWIDWTFYTLKTDHPKPKTFLCIIIIFFCVWVRSRASFQFFVDPEWLNVITATERPIRNNPLKLREKLPAAPSNLPQPREESVEDPQDGRQHHNFTNQGGIIPNTRDYKAKLTALDEMITRHESRTSDPTSGYKKEIKDCLSEGGNGGRNWQQHGLLPILPGSSASKSFARSSTQAALTGPLKIKTCKGLVSIFTVLLGKNTHCTPNHGLHQ